MNFGEREQAEQSNHYEMQLNKCHTQNISISKHVIGTFESMKSTLNVEIPNSCIGTHCCYSHSPRLIKVYDVF